VDDVVRRAAFGIAGEMQVLAFEAGGPRRVYEADLRSATRRMLQMHHKNRVLVEVSLKPAGWKAVGGVDIAVAGAKATSAFDALFELKWGGKVEETLWDAWKLAALYKEGRAYGVYLVSGAPAGNWDSTKPLTCLWRAGTYRSPELWVIAGSARWGEKLGPRAVPAGVRVKEIATVPVHTEDKVPWELRVVRLTTTPGQEWTIQRPAAA
jgi:hypothetical protein